MEIEDSSTYCLSLGFPVYWDVEGRLRSRKPIPLWVFLIGPLLGSAVLTGVFIVPIILQEQSIVVAVNPGLLTIGRGGWGTAEVDVVSVNWESGNMAFYSVVNPASDGCASCPEPYINATFPFSSSAPSPYDGKIYGSTWLNPGATIRAVLTIKVGNYATVGLKAANVLVYTPSGDRHEVQVGLNIV